MPGKMLVRAGIVAVFCAGCGTATEETRPAPAPPFPDPPSPVATPARAPAGKSDAQGGLAQLVEKEVKDRRASAVDWATYQGNPQRTGLAPDAPAIDVPRVRWKTKVGIQGYLNAPLVLGKVVVVPTSGRAHNAPDPDDGLHALEAATGKEIWRAAALGDANGATAADGKVVFGSDDHHVRAIDLATGKELWTLLRPGTVYSTPLVVEDTAVLGDASGRVFGVAMDTGKLRWEAGFTGAIRGGLASDGKIVFVVSQGGDVAALDRDGKERCGGPRPARSESRGATCDRAPRCRAARSCGRSRTRAMSPVWTPRRATRGFARRSARASFPSTRPRSSPALSRTCLATTDTSTPSSSPRAGCAGSSGSVTLRPPARRPRRSRA